VADLIAYTKLRNTSTCLGEKFLPESLLKFRFKFGQKKGKSLFQRRFPKDLIERVWDEIRTNFQDAVQVVHDDNGFGLITQMENNLRRFEGKRKSSRLW